MVPLIAISGRSGSGKTTLIVKLIAELKRRGYRVGTLKHDAHGFEIDHEGKDSYRHKRAGARCVVLSSTEKFAVIKDVDAEWHPARLAAAYLADADIVLLEGFKRYAFPRIEVVRAACSKRPVTPDDTSLRAYVTDLPMKTAKPVYGLNHTRRIASFIEREIISKQTPQNISLILDGEPIELDPCSGEKVIASIDAALKAIKKRTRPREVEIRLRLKRHTRRRRK